ncbi:nuclease-related domain-containing protein [Psychrobium sp. 1_MG-2023]|uniref:nuclease-related domain-containing protein n=1 Tax=Psychrobium sp. 1_MG-2023 TaxID=3062624 RepID=UPI000C33B16C|nr:nuclease-related domain-containing protein [Psychrobium sp. 1_MG-2023]MDP2562907.1 nuclease-related domain-containing protein [Psychrobium sp. 1_MG-2023]PKF54707.1 nuclease [Alteromonadales bacterium alter-6D02]
MSSVYLLLAFISPMLLILAFVMSIQKLSERKKAAPFNVAAEQRIAGHSLLVQLMDVSFNLSAYIMFSSVAFLYPLAVYGIAALTNTAAPSHWMSILIGFGFLSYCMFKVIKNFRLRKYLKLGLEAEWAVSNELNELKQSGYRVFHDIQCDGFNIDHLAIGPQGVFCIETKGRSKPLTKSKNKQFKVQTKGSTLQFPTWTDNNSVAQSLRQAKWASLWLSNATGVTVNAKPLLVIPGWFIEHKEKPTIPIFALKKLSQYITKLPSDYLTHTTINQIAYQVEQRVVRGDNYL